MLNIPTKNPNPEMDADTSGKFDPKQVSRTGYKRTDAQRKNKNYDPYNRDIEHNPHFSKGFI